jgi:hypothetical protein
MPPQLRQATRQSRPVVIVTSDPPDLSSIRLAVQFAAGFVVGVLLAITVAPIALSCPACIANQEQRQ